MFWYMSFTQESGFIPLFALNLVDAGTAARSKKLVSRLLMTTINRDLYTHLIENSCKIVHLLGNRSADFERSRRWFHEPSGHSQECTPAPVEDKLGCLAIEDILSNTHAAHRLAPSALTRAKPLDRASHQSGIDIHAPRCLHIPRARPKRLKPQRLEPCASKAKPPHFFSH